MQSINSSQVIIPIGQFSEESDTYFGEMVLVNNTIYEYVDIITDTESKTYCVFERTDKAIQELGVLRNKRYLDANRDQYERIKEEVQLVFSQNGYECYEIDYCLPRDEDDPIQVTACIHDFSSFNAEPNEMKKDIDNRLLSMNYEVMVDD